MDFGAVGLEGGGGLVCSDAPGLSISAFASSNAAAEVNKQKWYGSGFLKQDRSGANTAEDDWRHSNAMMFQQKSSLLRSNSNSLLSESHHQEMLSFSTPNSQTLAYPYYPAAPYSRTPGCGSGSLDAGGMHGILAGIRGPFTPSQWMELEHQALIYKYITSNVPIPSSLLIPIRKALDAAGFSSFPGLRPNTLGWSAFHLGFSNSTDPEPGRCRRTDGKKWRCSRDAVADQKYCERHMNRGRHRSRKPVEGQTGHSVPKTTTGTSKLPLNSNASEVVVLGGCASNNAGLAHHQANNSQPGENNPCSASHPFDRNLPDKDDVGQKYQDLTNLSILSPTMSQKDQKSTPKLHNPSEETSRTEFGLVCSDSLLNPVVKSSAFVNSRYYGTSEDLSARDDKPQHPLRQFMDEWPKHSPESSAVSWSSTDVHSDRTQLSISIPVTTSDYMSTTSSPNNEKLGSSPLRLLPELEATQIGLGVGATDEQGSRHANWLPMSWQTPVGGPLGEVLNSTHNGQGDNLKTSALNLMTEGWGSSPRMASSPTGVLQKTALGSLSNSSAGSSPRFESSKTHEGVNFCNGLLGSTQLNSTLQGLHAIDPQLRRH